MNINNEDLNLDESDNESKLINLMNLMKIKTVF